MINWIVIILLFAFNRNSLSIQRLNANDSWLVHKGSEDRAHSRLNPLLPAAVALPLAFSLLNGAPHAPINKGNGRNLGTSPVGSQPITRDEPTWRCRQNPSIGALRIQEPVILREPQINS